MASLARLLATVMVIAALRGGTARADDGGALRAGVLGALAATTSFAVDISNPQGITGSAIVLTQLRRTKVQGSAGPHTLALYTAGGEVYQQIDGAPWQRRKLPGGSSLLIAPLAGAPTFVPQPDVRDPSGMTFGAFRAVTSLPIPGVGTIPNVTLDCTYDKATMLPHVCASQYATLSFHNYNDPNNVVEVPADARGATELPPLDGLTPGRGK
jgi:hypothetical protein